MRLELPPALIRRVRPGQWLALDRVAAGGYALLALAPLLNAARGPAGLVAAPVGAVAFALPIAWRRTRPATAWALLLGGLAVVALTEPRALALGLVSLAALLYSVAATCQPQAAFAALAMSLGVALATALPDFRHSGAAVLFSLGYLTVWTVGFAVGLHRRHLADQLRGQADRAEAELAEARRGVAEERLRIARELHDVVAHSMSVITVQAGFGALVIEDKPEQAKAALAAIETTGRQALDEMRRLLGVLRADPPRQDLVGKRADVDEPQLTPAPGLADLDRLAQQTANTGVQVDIAVTGARRDLPPGIDLSAYRVVQEALTNVAKHAGVTRAWVALDYRPDELAIEVADAGRGCPDGAEPRPGHGLVGMRERVRLCGGTFAAAPRPGGGFGVSARFPLPASAGEQPR